MRCSACKPFKGYHINTVEYLLTLVAVGLMVVQFITLLNSISFSFLWLFSFSSISLVYHAIVAEMEEHVLVIETHIDPLGHSLHPNLLTPSGK